MATYDRELLAGKISVAVWFALDRMCWYKSGRFGQMTGTYYINYTKCQQQLERNYKDWLEGVEELERPLSSDAFRRLVARQGRP